MKYLVENRIYLGIAVFVFAASYFLLPSKVDDDSTSVAESASPKNLNSSSVSHPGKQTKSIKSSCADSDPLSTGLHPPRYDEMSVSNQLSEAFSNIALVIRNAEHDPNANIALFRMASSCFTYDLKNRPRRSENSCPPNAEILPVQNNNLEFLVKAAELGSNYAKLMYSQNAPMTADYFRKRSTSDGNLLAREIMLKAEKFGNEAARAGIPEAYRYMSQAYEQGTFGEKNIQLAYAYALPLRQLGTHIDQLHIERLGARLNDNMRKGAELQAFGCEVYDNRNIASPF